MKTHLLDVIDALIAGERFNEATHQFLFVENMKKIGEECMAKKQPTGDPDVMPQSIWEYIWREASEDNLLDPEVMTTKDSNEFSGMMTPVTFGYECLYDVLFAALDQSQKGKGKERHQVGNTPFKEQPILTITRRYGIGFALGQAEKKMEESQRLPIESAKKELLGAIVYLAAAYIKLEEDESNSNR